jgi:hypothetical protein
MNLFFSYKSVADRPVFGCFVPVIREKNDQAVTNFRKQYSRKSIKFFKKCIQQNETAKSRTATEQLFSL